MTTPPKTGTMLSTSMAHFQRSLAQLNPGDADLFAESTIDKAIKLIATAINSTNPSGTSNRALARQAQTLLAKHPEPRAILAMELANTYLAATEGKEENSRVA